MRAPTLVGFGIVLIAATALAAILLIDRAGGAGGAAPEVLTSTNEPAEGVTVEAVLTTNMRASADRVAELVAIIPGGRAAEVTGQSSDGSWLQVVYPIGSRLEGWVPAANVVVRSGDTASVPVIDVAAADAEPASTGGTAVPTSGSEPDLQVTSAFVAPSGTLTIRFANVGRGPFDAATSLRVTSAAGEVVGVVDIERTLLRPGRSATVNTQIVIERTGEYVLEADWLNEVDESNEFNNALRTLLVSVTP